MLKLLLKFLFCLIFFFCSCGSAFAIDSNVVINEIAWMGTQDSYSNEWIELFNPGESPVSLSGWSIESKNTKLNIALSGQIRAKSYFLLERTDEKTLPNIKADQIYKGGLSNNGLDLSLINSSGKKIDEIDCSLGWFAGDNETKKTMERINPLISGIDLNNWQTSQKTGGTPKALNSPERKKIEPQELKTISPNDFNYGNFSSVLGFGIVTSMFLSMLSLAFLLKIRQKRDKIKKDY